jgi:uncharacterized HAD superfamily protein
MFTTSERKPIYVDLDDVLCETARFFLTIVERDFGKQVPYEKLTNFDVGTACGLNSHEREELYRTVHKPEALLELAAIAGAAEKLSQWRDAGYEIAVVTGRPPDSYEPSLEWLARNRIPYDPFFMVDKYGRYANWQENILSLEAFSSRRFSWAVEDSLSMANFLASRMDTPVTLLNRPWNRTTIDAELISRCDRWREIKHFSA